MDHKVKPGPISKAHYHRAGARILYHLKWNILPVVAMLIVLTWIALQAGNLIDESRPSTTQAIGLAD